MTPDAYQSQAVTTAVYPERGTGSLQALAYCALGLGEVGEVQGKLKKVLRGDVTLSDQREALLDELGDVLWYVAVMADELGCSLGTLLQANLDKLARRKATGTIRGSGDAR